MREFYPGGKVAPHFATIRHQLLWSHGVLVVIIFSMAGVFSWIFVNYYDRVDELMFLNAATATITVKVEETHQLLENTINYEDPSYIPFFYDHRDDLNLYINEYDALALRTAELSGDYDAYYQFLEIQKLILSYVVESDALLKKFEQKVTRFFLYDNLYSLRDLNYQIYELQSALLVRQNNYLRRFYSEYTPVVHRRLILLLILILVFGVFSIFWTLRQASAISAPLHQLVQMNLELARGDFSVVKPLDVKNEELHKLGNAFTYMAGKLFESIEAEQRSLIMESSLKQARLETLQAQINPHFLFNALNTVRSLSQLENAEKTEEIIDALSSFLRYNIENQNSTVKLSEEFTTTENYLRVQKIRFGKRLEYIIKLDPSIGNILVPSLLIQPLVENAIIHGIEPLKHGGKILLFGKKEHHGAVLEIIDNGIGINQSQSDSLKSELKSILKHTNSHVGIRNTWQRLALSNPDAQMDILPNPKGRGTLIRLILSTET